MRRYRPELLISIFLIALTLSVYWQVQHYEFVNLDDDHYITENPNIRNGLTKEGLRWALTFNDVSYWHPLTWLSHMLDCQLYGVAAQGHHFNSLLLHIINALLLFLILKQMTGALWRSAVVAALFALHPVNVESVAWVANRKSVLSAFFWLVTIGAYVYYASRPGVLRYLVVFLCFALGALAKPMVVTLPFVLLLLDYWPLGRVQFGSSAKTLDSRDARLTQTRFERASASRLILEKMPLIVLSATSIYISFLSSRSLGILVTSDTIPASLRIQNAMVSYVNYILKMIWPRDLAVFYPYPEVVPFWQYAGASLLLVFILVIAVRLARKAPYFIVGWLWFLGTLIPVIGMVQQGLWPALADRFAYVPLIGLCIIIVWGFGHFAAKWRLQRIVFPVSAGIVLSALGIGTWMQAQYWKNSSSLFGHALDVTAKNHLAHLNIAAAFQEQGDLSKALLHYSKALRIMPDNAQFHNGLGSALLGQGRIEEAIVHFSEALRLVPDYPQAHVNMGSALVKRGNIEEAISHFHQALNIKPLSEAYHALGLVLAGQGQLEEAVSYYQQALRIKPYYAAVHNDLGVALSFQGKGREAISHFSEALQIKPDFDGARHNLKVISGKLNDQKGRLKDGDR